MNRHNLFGTIAPLALAALLAVLAGCDTEDRARNDVGQNGVVGVPLDKFDLSGAVPTGVVLLGPDEVRIRQGDGLAISIDGDRQLADTLRFSRYSGALLVQRSNGEGVQAGKAIINITMPAPAKLFSQYSGTISAEALAADAVITIVGSGNIETLNVAAENLRVQIGGSGIYQAAGTAGRLKLRIMGSGQAQMAALKVDNADIGSMGSGLSTFASDGTVTAKMEGSGDVRVYGAARCQAATTGSGKLICNNPAPVTPAT